MTRTERAYPLTVQDQEVSEAVRDQQFFGSKIHFDREFRHHWLKCGTKVKVAAHATREDREGER